MGGGFQGLLLGGSGGGGEARPGLTWISGVEEWIEDIINEFDKTPSVEIAEKINKQLFFLSFSFSLPIFSLIQMFIVCCC